MPRAAIRFYVRLPSGVSFVPGDTQKTRRAFGYSAPVLMVLRGRCQPQISNPIVIADMIDVINLTCGEVAVNI
tara:strand:+ start:280 stop:498 length:219 start_codon:yes stop_codon:yes gene_type:complete